MVGARAGGGELDATVAVAPLPAVTVCVPAPNVRWTVAVVWPSSQLYGPGPVAVSVVVNGATPDVVPVMRLTARVTFSVAVPASSLILVTSNTLPESGSSYLDGPSPWPLPSVAMSTSREQPQVVESGWLSTTCRS